MKYSVIRVVFEFPPIVGGSVTHIIELALAMDQVLEEQVIIAPHFEGCENFDRKFPIRVIRVHIPKSLSFGNLILPSPVLFLYSFGVIRKVKELVENDMPGCLILHVHGPMLGAFLALHKTMNRICIPIVVMEHGYGSERSVGHRISRIFTQGLLTAIFPPTRVLLLNDGTKIEVIRKRLQKLGIPSVTVLHGIDTEFFKPIPRPDVEDTFVVLFPHRIESVKKPDLAIRIFKKFLEKSNSKDARLVILSSGDASRLRELALENGISSQVVFAGLQDTEGVRRHLNSCDVVIGTSLESNMNRAIHEAMACERPVITFDSGGTSELVRNMFNGILVEPNDIDGFADYLKLLYLDTRLRNTLGRNARESILMERSWTTRVKKELDAYRGLCENEDS